MAELHPVIAEWQASWMSLDADRISNLYADDAEHMSHLITERVGVSSGVLKSRAAIQLYIDAAVKRLTSFRADIITTITDCDGDSGRAAVEYWRTINDAKDRRNRVLEIIEWRDNKLTSCRVFHF